MARDADAPRDEYGPRGRRHYHRVGDATEFSRVVSFSDGVFSIAMTLLVFTINVPRTATRGGLEASLRDLTPEILSFFLSFTVIGFYWLEHHRFFGTLAAVSRRMLFCNLVYLALVAFLPVPTEVLGEYGGRHTAVILYAVCVGLVSAMETVLYLVAVGDGLLKRTPPPHVFRFGLTASLVPVAVFALSVPISLWRTDVAMASWVLLAFIRPMAHRRRPPGAEVYYSG
jgi:TMEM175 potassium channel family protein